MKYKRERRSKPKSKSSKLDRRKLKKYLKQEGISLEDAVVMLDSRLASRGKPLILKLSSYEFRGCSTFSTQNVIQSKKLFYCTVKLK